MAYREGPGSTFTHNGKEYPLDPFIERARKQPQHMVHVSKLKWALDYGTPDEARVEKADLSVPILYTIDPEHGFVVIDGFHRLVKAVRAGRSVLKAKEIPQAWFDTISMEDQRDAVITVAQINEAMARSWMAHHGVVDTFTPDRTPHLDNETAPGRLWFMAYADNEEGVGIAALMNRSYYLPLIWVKPNWRGVGVGKTLVDSLRADMTTVPREHIEAVKFFERLSFTEIARTEKFVMLRRPQSPEMLSVQ